MLSVDVWNFHHILIAYHSSNHQGIHINPYGMYIYHKCIDGSTHTIEAIQVQFFEYVQVYLTTS
jgi:hypothetical protein